MTESKIERACIDYKTKNVSFIDSKAACVHTAFTELEDGHAEQPDVLRKPYLKVKYRCFKFHDFITSPSISQMLADLLGAEFKIIVSKFRKR